MKTILYNPIFINPLAYYVFPRLTRYLQPDNESTAEPANYIGTIEVKVIAYGDTTLKRTYTNTDSIDLSEFKNTWIRISLFTKVGSCVLGEWKIGNMESDLPYIDPEVLASLKAVVIVGNKTNNDSDRAIVKNLVDASNPFVISNASYNLNSGYGKYNITFQHFPYRENIISINDNKVVFDKGGLLLLPYPSMDRDIPSFKVKVSGLSGTYHFRYYYRDSNGAQDSINMAKDGIYELPICYNVQSSSDGTNCGFANNGSDIVTIELVPEFQGAFVTDGVNDLITSTKTVQEMLGGSNEITVVSMIHQIDGNVNYTNGYTNYIRHGGGFIRNSVSGINGKGFNKTGIYGYTSTQLNSSNMGLGNVINNILGDKDDYSFERSSTYTLDDAKYSVQNFVNANNQPSNEGSSIAWYWTIIANKVLTTDQINQVIAYFNLDRTLKPDILCNTIKQGITNENHAEFGDKLIDYSGNGRDIQLNNLAWKGDSGIGKYETDFTKWLLDPVLDITRKYSSFNIKTKNDSRVNSWAVRAQDTVIPSMKVKVTGISSSVESLIYRYSVIDDKDYYIDITSDGIYELPQTNGKGWEGFRFIGKNVNISVEQIPSHAGALCLDGVNDFGKVTGMPVYKDYTVVTDREIFANIGAISSKNNPGAFVETAGNSVYSFGQATSGLNLISTRSISYLSKYSYCGQSITAGAAEDGTDMWLGTIRDNDSRFFNGAIYSLMSFPYSMSEFLIERQLKKHKLGTLYPDMVEFRPVIKANANYNIFYTALLPLTGNIWERINIGDYVPVGRRIAIQMSFDNEASELVSAISSQLGNISITKNSNNKGYTIFGDILKNKSPQKINITIDEYIRYEDIVQPYPVLLRFNDENGNEVSWGGKFRVGSTITRIGSAADSNLLPNIYNIFGLLLNDNQVTSSKVIVEKTMVFKAKSAYIFDNNEPKCILSPRLLRIPNSSYKILGYIPDISGHGNHGKINNSAYAGASGANGYLQNFSGWNKASGVSSTDSVISSSNNLVAANGWIAYVTSGTVIPTFKVEISGIPVNGNLRFEGSDQTLVNGVNIIQGITTTKVSGFYISNGYDNDWSNLRIEQIGEYEGAYCLDGVDDFVTIPTLSSGGKQVLMKVNWSSLGMPIYEQRTPGKKNFAIISNSTAVAYIEGNDGNTYIDGILNNNIKGNELVNITHNITITNELSEKPNTSPMIGMNNGRNAFTKMSLYDFMLFDNISTDDKIKELNEYVGIEAKVELPPYYYDAYGKTNLDADKATIQQRGVAVGDYDLINYNHAYEGMSGYNGYPVVFGANKTWEILSSVYSYISDVTSTTIHVTMVKNAGTGLLFSYVKKDEALTNIKEIPAFRVTIKGLEGNSKFGYRYLATEDATEETLVYLGNGTHELAKSFAPTEALLDLTRNAWVGIFITPMVEGEVVFDCDITIEVLPEYENGLVYDGITDYSKNANIPALDDFTAIIKREWLKKQGCPLIKGSKVYEGGNGNALLLEWDKAYNFVFYKRTDIMEGELPDNISFITPTNYNGNVITRGSEQDTNGICIAGDGNAGFANMVFYKLILYPKTIPLLQINFLKNLMERDEIIDLNNKIFIQE